VRPVQSPESRVQGREDRVPRPASRIPHPVVWALLVGMILGAQAVLTLALIAQHRAYNSSAFDLGFFDQIIWNTAHGRWFETTFVPYNFAGQHFEPVLLLFAAIYRVAPSVVVLFVVQSALAAWAALPLFLAARRLLASATAALLVAAAYLIAPHLHSAAVFDFHPEVMGPFAIFAAFALLTAGRPGWALTAILTLLLLKEDTAIACAGFAIIVWLFGYRRQALALVAVAALYLVAVVGVAMPLIREGRASDLHGRYGYVGDSPRAVVETVLTRPDVIAPHLAGPEQRRALATILGAQGLLPLASLAALAAAPLLAANVMSQHPPQRDLIVHYPILPFALLFVASVLGIRTLARSRRLAGLWRAARLDAGGRVVALAALLLAAQSLAFLLRGELGPAGFEVARWTRPANAAALDRIVALVPADASLSAQSGILPHLSQRERVWEFPALHDAEYVIVDTRGWRAHQSDAAGYDATLASLPARGYCLLTEEEGVMLYARRSPCPSP
jgi:uncharacterized membrane protein